MFTTRTSASIVFLVVLSALTGCGKSVDETSARNNDGTCKTGFVGAYNQVVTDVKTATEATKLITPNSSGAETQAALDTMVAAAKKAQISCTNLLSNYSGLGTCEAKNPANGDSLQAKAEDMKTSCDAMTQLADLGKYSTSSMPTASN